MLFRSRGTGRGGGDGRRARRLRTNMLNCHLGSVVDISPTGLQVKGEGRPPVKKGQLVQLKLETAQQRLPVTAQVVWVRRRGLRKYVIGLKFLETSRSIVAAVESLARFGFIDLDSARRKQGGGMQARMRLPDYYGLLGLSLGASPSEIKKAYRNMARKYHPDVCQDPEGPAKFTRITQAYEVLGDQRSRKSYDQRLREALAV